MTESTPADVLDALRHIVDPEVGMNIVDLGLVYTVEVGGGDVSVRLTMTTAACPLGESISEQARTAILRQVPGATSVNVELVWDPPWEPSMMSDAAREQLGWR
jgi:metal-sulfur cluster biosynthetic enzyme